MGQMRVYPVQENAAATITDYAGNTADIRQNYGENDEKTNARAARYAAGWNLLETLEEMDAVAFLEASASLLQQSSARASAAEMRRLRDAIRTALESKP